MLGQHLISAELRNSARTEGAGREEESRWEKQMKQRTNVDRMINLFQNGQNRLSITACNGTHTFFRVYNVLSWYRDTM